MLNLIWGEESCEGWMKIWILLRPLRRSSVTWHICALLSFFWCFAKCKSCSKKIGMAGSGQVQASGQSYNSWFGAPGAPGAPGLPRPSNCKWTEVRWSGLQKEINSYFRFLYCQYNGYQMSVTMWTLWKALDSFQHHSGNWRIIELQHGWTVWSLWILCWGWGGQMDVSQ